jgi:hypothetical protein
MFARDGFIEQNAVNTVAAAQNFAGIVLVQLKAGVTQWSCDNAKRIHSTY